MAVVVAALATLVGCSGSGTAHRASPGVAGHPVNMSAYDDTVRIATSTTCGGVTPGGGSTTSSGSATGSGSTTGGTASSGSTPEGQGAAPGSDRTSGGMTTSGGNRTSGAGGGGQQVVAGEGLTDGRFVLTTASVVAGARSATVTNRQGQHVPARLVTVDPEANVAWLYAPGLPSRPTSPATATDHVAPAYVFAVGERSVSVLRALSLERTTRTGTDVYRRHAVTRPVYVLHLDRPSTVDVVGSPVLDEDGRLLGLVLSGAAGDTEVVALAGDAVARSPATDGLRQLADPAVAPMPVTRCLS